MRSAPAEERAYNGNDIYDVMNMETAMLRYLMQYLKENYQPEIKILDADIPEITEIPSIKFEDAVALIKGSRAKNKFDLEPEDEVFLCDYAKDNYGTEFIFVTNFPASKPPFYAMNDREDPRTACKFDLLFRGLEITTGSQHIHDYDEQIEKMKAQGLILIPDYKVYKKWGQNLAYMDFAQIFCLHFNEGLVLIPMILNIISRYTSMVCLLTAASESDLNVL